MSMTVSYVPSLTQGGNDCTEERRMAEPADLERNYRHRNACRHTENDVPSRDPTNSDK
jgi:hypothetical protein